MHSDFARRGAQLLSAAAAGALLAALAFYLHDRPRSLPQSASIIERVREVARLETLDAALYKKVKFNPDPPASDGLFETVWNWAKFNVSAPKGRAIVFAVAHVGLDLSHLGAEQLRVSGPEVWIVLPAPVTQIEMNPGETEVIDSTLDSQQTAALMGLAKEAIEREVKADARLQERAQRSAERALRALLIGLGFTEVHFVETLPSELSAG